MPYVPGQTFSDVPAGHWAESDLALLYEAGLANGYPDGTFRPDNPQSRIETVAFMARVLRRIIAVEQRLAGIRVTHGFRAQNVQDPDPTLADGVDWNAEHVVTVP